MTKYIDADRLRAEIERREKIIRNSANQISDSEKKTYYSGCADALLELLPFIDSLQQEQPKDKQIVVITESHGNANIEWDCRSLVDVIALLKSAESFITEKQIEKIAGPGSGPDYATTEGRYSHLFKLQEEQPEVDLEKEIDRMWSPRFNLGWDDNSLLSINHKSFEAIARHFAEWGAEHIAGVRKMIEPEKKEGRTDCSSQGEVPTDSLATQSYEKIPNDLEEAAREYAKTTFKKPYSDNPGEEVTIVEPDKYAGFIAGVEWQKEQDEKDISEKIAAAYQLGLADKEEQMLKEAVETEVTETCGISSVWIKTKQFKPGQKVRIIIVKED